MSELRPDRLTRSQALIPSAPSVPAIQEAINILDVARAQQLLRPLSSNQRKFLRFRGLYESDMACSTALGLGREFGKNSLRRSPAFREAYQAILVDPVVHAMAELALLAPKAVQRLDDLMDDSDGKTAVKAVEHVLKSKGVQILGEMTLKVKDDRDPEENPYVQALMRLQARRMRMDQRQFQGALGRDADDTESGADGDTVDAQFSYVQEAENTQPAGTENTAD